MNPQQVDYERRRVLGQNLGDRLLDGCGAGDINFAANREHCDPVAIPDGRTNQIVA